MGMILKFTKRFSLIAILLPFMSILSIVIYFEYTSTKKEVFSVIQKHYIDSKIELFKNYADYITQNYSENLKEKMASDDEFIIRLENELSVLKDSEIKYLYILYRDDDGKFRYLIDTTKEVEQKAEYNQKFDTQLSIWDNVYKTKIFKVAYQKELQTLWITIAYPIVIDGRVDAIIGSDLTYEIHQEISNTLKPIEKVYIYVIIFIAIMLLIIYFLIFIYYKTKNKSFLDPLTKVYNRQYLDEFLQTKSLENYFLFMIDLDFFKHINDSYGHDAGDEVLVAVSHEIKLNIRTKDVFIRFGGEEFLLFVHNKNIKDPAIVGNRIRQAVENIVINAHNNQIKITLSLGVNPFPHHSKDIDEAIKIADEQLYIAKTLGRNRVEIFTENTSESKSSKRISDVQLAIDEDRIKFAFQPIYSIKSNKIDKYEMLIRMFDINGSIVTPDNFLPSVKHTQVYISLTQLLIDTALEVLIKENIELSINLDLQDILNDDIMNFLKLKFLQNKTLASRLTIEVLEHEEINNFSLMKERINILKDMGFKIALDDFGSGYANFRYLMELNLDILKIDGTIIQGISKDVPAYNIVKTIVGFAKSMNIKTVAEHVEIKEEMEVLKEIDVDYLQGYYLGKPAFDF